MRHSTRSRLFSSIMVIVGLAGFSWMCQYPNAPVHPNSLPYTIISNLQQNDTVAKYINRNAFPELDLSWVGGDPDGYVIAFQYRWSSTRPGVPFPPPGNWTTALNLVVTGWDNVIVVQGNPSSIFNIYHFLATLGGPDTSLIRVIGDSLATNRPFAVPYKTGIVPTDSIYGMPLTVLQTPNKGTFIFDSPADSNFHKFEVRAVDNSDATDPAPPRVFFWTLVSPGSICRIDQVPTDGEFAIRHPTDRWQGLRFAFSSLDPNNTESIVYQWSVDDTLHWTPWSSDQVAYVTASDFRPIESGTHVFHVRAKNRWGVISPDSSRPFRAVIPKFDDPTYPKRTLIVNNDINGNGTRGRPTNAQIDSVYRAIMDSLGRTGMFDIWRVATSVPANRFPPHDTLGYYSSVLFLTEQLVPAVGAGAQQKLNATTQNDFRNYFLVGGKLIWSGTPSIVSAINNYNTLGQLSGTWATDIFHITPITPQTPFIVSQGLDFNGVRGFNGYPNVSLDTMTIAPDSINAFRNIGGIAANFPAGFAETISLFDSKSNNFMENLPVGIRYIGYLRPPARRTFSVIFFGFPLYNGERSAVIQSLRQAFSDIEE